MNRSSHLLRRGAAWHYRRRLPGSRLVIQIPLGTSDRESAVRIAAHLTAGFDMTLDRLLRADRLIPDDLVAKYFDFCLRRLVQELTRQRRRVRMSGAISPADRRADEIRRLVTGFMIEDGLSPDLPPHRIAAFETPEDLELALKIHVEQFISISRSAMRPHFKAAASMILETADRRPDQIHQLTEAYLHANAAALEIVDEAPAAHAAIARARAAELLARRKPDDAEILSEHRPAAVLDAPPPPPPASSPAVRLTDGVTLIDAPLTHEMLDAQFETARASKESIDRSPRSDPFSHDLAGVCERSIKRAQADGKMDDKTADSRRMSIKLFMFISGLQIVTEVEQHHLAIFVKALKALPKNFNRSAHDRRKTYAAVVAEARSLSADQLGRDPGTVNRHLDTVGAIIGYARVQDRIPVDRDIDTKKLRVPETKRARHKRSAFQRDEVTKLFQHPIWHGCRSETRRREPGNTISRDGLFWVPLIVHYTGARLEEIAGLPAAAVMSDGNEWGFDIRPHEERRLKNLQSERLLPVHEHLIELGLIQHRDRMLKLGEEYLFPELRPKNPKFPFHKAMKYNWDMARKAQLGDAAKGLTMHSLRHYVNITLKGNKSVEKSVRLDILGHAAEDLNEEVYTAGATFSEKLAAIDSIPRAF